MDLIICLPKTDRGVDAIATFVDCLSKYTYVVPITTLISASNLAQVFVSTVVAWHEVPKHPISDCDPRFLSAFQKGLISTPRAQVAIFSAYHPQMDGQSKRQHHPLEQILRCFMSPRQHNWDLLLPCVEFALNS